MHRVPHREGGEQKVEHEEVGHGEREEKLKWDFGKSPIIAPHPVPSFFCGSTNFTASLPVSHLKKKKVI